MENQSNPPQAPETSRPLNDFAVASLVMGLLSFLQLAGIEKALAAIAFGVLAWRAVKRANQRGSRLAIAGIVLGLAYIAFAVYSVVVYWPQIMQFFQQV